MPRNAIWWLAPAYRRLLELIESEMKILCSIISFLAILLNCNRASAQDAPENPYFVKAYNFITKGNVDSAKFLIDIAIGDSNVNKNALGLYVRGFIYKEVFKKCTRLVKPTIGMGADMCRDLWGEPDHILNTDHGNAMEQKWIYGSGSFLVLKNNALSSYQMGSNTGHFNIKNPYKYGDTALMSFFRSLKIDSSAENKLNCAPNINYIAKRYYVHASQLIDSVHYPTAIGFYRKFKQAMLKLESGNKLTPLEISFHMALGDIYSSRFFHLNAGNSKDAFLDSAKGEYNIVLSLNPNEVGANYSLAILYYNQAVNIINNLSYDVADLHNINKAQDTELVLMKRSLPYMEKTYQLDPKKKDAIEGLKGIYYLLHEYQKSDEYNQKLKELEEKQ